MCFSATKGVASTCAHVLADRGELDYDERVATYWPEFAQNGKRDITVRQVLSHRRACTGSAPSSITDRGSWTGST